MNHQDHVRLIKDGIHQPDGIWADFGSGRGAFTLALADLLKLEAQIYSIDQDWLALQQQKLAIRRQFPEMQVVYQRSDFTKSMVLPALDGLVMANALHFVPHRHKVATLQLLQHYLKNNGRLIIVEYNVDQGNRWVPYPFSWRTWHQLAAESGLGETRLLATRPSSFLGEIYAAVSVKGS